MLFILFFRYYKDALSPGDSCAVYSLSMQLPIVSAKCGKRQLLFIFTRVAIDINLLLERHIPLATGCSSCTCTDFQIKATFGHVKPEGCLAAFGGKNLQSSAFSFHHYHPVSLVLKRSETQAQVTAIVRLEKKTEN